jgi:preprotein translocase subunit SecG
MMHMLAIVLLLVGLVLLKAFPFLGAAAIFGALFASVRADDEDPKIFYRVVGWAIVILIVFVIATPP